MGPVKEKESKPIRQHVVEYLAGQPFNNVLLVLILAAIGWGAVKLVPVHLKQIQDGYETLDRNFREERKEMEAAHRQERKDTIEMLRQMFGTKVAGGS